MTSYFYENPRKAYYMAEAWGMKFKGFTQSDIKDELQAFKADSKPQTKLYIHPTSESLLPVEFKENGQGIQNGVLFYYPIREQNNDKRAS